MIPESVGVAMIVVRRDADTLEPIPLWWNQNPLDLFARLAVAFSAANRFPLRLKKTRRERAGGRASIADIRLFLGKKNVNRKGFVGV
jgi:hypothetical protein